MQKIQSYNLLLSSHENLIKTYLLVQILKLKNKEALQTSLFTPKSERKIKSLSHKLSCKLIDLFKGNHQKTHDDTEILKSIFINLCEFFYSKKIVGNLILDTLIPQNESNAILAKIFDLSNQINDFNEQIKAPPETNSSLSKLKSWLASFK